MASTFGARPIGRTTHSVPPARSLGRRMTVHAAAALIVFAVLQVWLVSSAIAAGAPSALTVAALVIILALAVPTVRIVERHRSEEHTSELQSLMRISYAVFCLK